MDKNTLKVLKYLSRHSGRISYNKLKKKFKNIKNPNFAEIEHWLSSNKYICFDGYSEDGCGNLIDPQAVVLTIGGKQLLTERSDKQVNDTFARITSIAALILSLANFIMYYFIKY